MYGSCRGLTMTDEIYSGVKPKGTAFARERETMTNAEVEAMFASFQEGDHE